MDKTYIYNKVKTTARRAGLVLLAPLFLTSCLDTIILPDDKTVDEDFWQTKADVASMVNAAYAAMTGDDVFGRLIVWGSFRSDEVTLGESGKNSGVGPALAEIATVNMQTTNTFAAWSSIYTVINRCNMVLDRAQAVMAVDPSYTQGDYETDRSQMLALRALCYFYLVRNFRDVPYVTEAYMNSSQNMQLFQSSPAEVLEHCIADLEEAARTPIAARGFSVNEWQRVGWMTNDAINALLADIYLWRASVTHSAADYQRSIDYCDLVIASKKSQHVRGRNEVEEKEFPLASAGEAYTQLFIDQNAEESIFELQSRGSTAICQYLFKYGSNSSAEGFLKASPMFGSYASKVVNLNVASQVFSDNDLRFYASCYDVKGGGENNLDIRKMIGASGVTTKTAQTRASDNNIAYGALNRNFIVYRLTDIMLMKAEALVQQVDTTETDSIQKIKLRDAYRLVAAVNTRSLHSENLADSMTWEAPCNYKDFDKDKMEQLVLQERLRELCFEGKRWYDLMRYNYRHVDYDATKYRELLYDLNEQNALGQIYGDMKTLMVRGSGADGSAVAAKMRNEAYLYMPVPNSDIIVCPLLRQNPAYKNTNDYEKSY